MVTMRSPSGMNDDSALSMVVLPVPVPPLISTFSLACTQAPSSPTISGVTLPICTRSCEAQRLAAEAADGQDGAVDAPAAG